MLDDRAEIQRVDAILKRIDIDGGVLSVAEIDQIHDSGSWLSALPRYNRITERLKAKNPTCMSEYQPFRPILIVKCPSIVVLSVESRAMAQLQSDLLVSRLSLKAYETGTDVRTDIVERIDLKPLYLVVWARRIPIPSRRRERKGHQAY